MSLTTTCTRKQRTRTLLAGALFVTLTFVATLLLASPADAAETQQTSVATTPATGKSAQGPAPYVVEQPKPATVAALVAAGILVVLLITAGVLLIARGLRDDLRSRKRSYRRRSRRIDARSSRPPAAPAS
jgi:hypothetical protein